MSRVTMQPLPSASVRETVATLWDVVVPMFARGIILRRPRIVALAARMNADRRAGARLGRLRARHGSGPVRLRVPGRRVALVLDPDDVGRVLAQSPEPFTPAAREKRAALAHFQPDGVLISHGEAREERRRFTEEVLEPAAPIHGCADGMLAPVRRMVDDLGAGGRPRSITWPESSGRSPGPLLGRSSAPPGDRRSARSFSGRALPTTSRWTDCSTSCEETRTGRSCVGAESV